MNKLWQVWYGTLSKEQVDHLVAIGERASLGNPGLGFGGESKNNDVRKTEISWIPKNTPDGDHAELVLRHYAMEANKNAFGFNVDDLSDMQYTKYSADSGGKYDWHIDTFWANPTAYDRKISVIVQLSDGGDYEGGDFQIDPQYENPDPKLLRQKGTVIVFPSFLPHRVTKLTSGNRISLVSWLQGPKFR